MATTETVKLVNDPAEVDVKGKKATRVRFVIKAPSKRYKDRFVNGLLFGKDGEDAMRLAKGDVVQVSGQLCVGSYFSKKEKREVDADEMGFGWRIERILQSKTFFGQAEPAAEAPAEPEEPVAKGASPLDNLDL